MGRVSELVAVAVVEGDKARLVAQLAELGALQIGWQVAGEAVVDVDLFLVRGADPGVQLHADFRAAFRHRRADRLHRLRVGRHRIVDQVDRADAEAFAELLELGEIGRAHV